MNKRNGDKLTDVVNIKKMVQEAAAAEKKNQIDAAMQILRSGLKQFPGQQELIIALAQLYEKLKKYPEAHSIYIKLVDKAGKTSPVAALGLARCLLAMSRFEQARKLLAPLYQQSPNSAEVLIGLARCAQHRGELADAAKLLDKAQQIEPNNRQARHERARLQIANKEYNDAIAILEKNIDRDDPYGDSIDLWIETLKTQKRELYQRQKLREFTEKHPQRPEFIFGLGLTYSRAGEIDNARIALGKVSKMLPGNFRILYELGVVERIAGNIELSNRLFEQVLELKPDHAAALRTYGLEFKYSYGDKEFTRLNTVAADMCAMEAMDQLQIHYALGKAYDDVAEYPTAFKHYEVGGYKKRKQDAFNEQASARMFEVMKALVNKESMAKVEQTGCSDDTAVFILGMPRSGTSLIEQILSSHPDIYGGGELKYMTSAMENIDILERRLKLGDVEAAFPYDLNASYEQRGQWYMDMLKSLAPKPYRRMVDKMPGNFNFVGLIHAILPNARILHSRRHPVETCLSCYRILFAEGHQWTYNLNELGRYYRRYWDLMRHWREQFPGVMYEIRYEDNINDVEGQARSLINYLGLEWNDACLNFYDTDRPVKTASASQVRKPIYKTSTNRWRKYETYLKPLLDEIGDLVEQYEAELEQSPHQRQAI
jgi:tetratricopeptide (TPR) repeat protein